MDCKTARLLLDVHQPRAGEIDPEEFAALESHCAACPDCAAVAHAERLADARLAAAVSDVPLPDGLRGRLLGRLADDRRAAFRRKAVWMTRVASGAAAGLLVAFGITYWIFAHRPALNLEAVRDAEIEKMGSPRAEWVQEWFRAHRGVAMVAPAQFDYAFLAHYDMGDCQGKRVPQLVFVRDQADARTWASVYVVSRRQFDLARLPEETAGLETQGFRVLVQPDDEDPDTAFLIFFTGASLDPLRSARAG